MGDLEEEEVSNRCQCCSTEAHFKCSQCKYVNVNYCSKECQREDWKSHKTIHHPELLKKDKVEDLKVELPCLLYTSPSPRDS